MAPPTVGRRPLFLGVGQLGWATMGAVLTRAYVDSDVDVVNMPKARPTGTTIDRIRGMDAARAVHRFADMSFKGRGQRLAAVLDQLAEQPSHVHCFGHLVAVPEVFRQRRIRFSVSADEAWTTATAELYRPRNALERRRYDNRIAVERDIFESASFVSCISRWAADAVVGNFAVDPQVVHVDPFPLPLSPAPTRRRADADRLTFIGNDFARKGGDRLICWHQAELADIAELHIVSSAPAPRNLASLHNVVWHGPVPNERLRSEILPRTAVLALPTNIDQSPYVLSEAAACGVACVASNIAGIPELVIDGETGFVIDPGDEQGFILQLSRLLSDRTLAADMGAAAHTHLTEVLRPSRTPGQLLQRVLGQ